jgi:hypothetical protein
MAKDPKLLQDSGYDVYTHTLTGLGASSRPAHELNRISLGIHVKDIKNLLLYEAYLMLCL